MARWALGFLRSWFRAAPYSRSILIVATVWFASALPAWNVPTPIKGSAAIVFALGVVLAARFDWANYVRGFPTRLKVAGSVGGGAVVFAVIGGAFATLLIWYGRNLSGFLPSSVVILGWIVAGFAAMILLAGAGGAIWGLVFGLRDDDRSAFDTVLNQKALGDAGHAPEEKVDAALRDEPERDDPAPKFKE
jgi:hypothetical protein